MPDRELRSVHLVGATGEMSIGTYRGTEHLVVPVVALVEGVVRPMGADVAEYVPIDVLAVAPSGWNGRPVVMDHPTRDGAAISANDPEVLESHAFGHIFNARIDGDRLKLEAWIDPAMAEHVGPAATSTVERLQSGEMVEVSVGAFVVAQRRSGTVDGARFGAVWAEVTPDHLAMLPEGVEGACSVEMGCGAPRAAMRVTEDGWEPVQRRGLDVHDVSNFMDETPTPFTEESEPPDGWKSALQVDDNETEEPETNRSEEQHMTDPKRPGLLKRVMAGIRDLLTDSSLRAQLWDALHDTEPGFEGIAEVDPDEMWVVYEVWREDDWATFRQTFTVTEDEQVSLNDDPEPVRADTEWVAAAGCGCDDAEVCECAEPRAATENTPTEPEEEAAMADLSERVSALIDNDDSPFTEADEEYLSGLSEERIAAFEEAAQEPETVEPKTEEVEEEQESAPETEDTDSVTLSRDELDDLRAAASAHKRQQAQRKAELVASLKAAQAEYSEDDLKAMDVEALTRLARLVDVDEPSAPDYSGRGYPRGGAELDDLSAFEPPDPYGLNADKAEVN